MTFTADGREEAIIVTHSEINSYKNARDKSSSGYIQVFSL